MQIIKTLHNILLPYQCILCQSFDCQQMDLCVRCYKILPWLNSTCQICANPMPETHVDNICGRCLKNPPYFDRVTALFHYQKPINEMIKQFKFRQKIAHGALLATLLSKQLNKPLPKFTLESYSYLIPIPLHKKRLKQRGYNQSLELARMLAKTIKIPVYGKALTRIKITQPQVQILARDRNKNVKNAFQCKQNLNGKSILLLDDVITTAATINEASKTLKAAGADYVHVLSLARTNSPT